MKTVSFKAHKIIGMVYNMLIVLDQWKGKKDLLVVNLDDFDIILNIDFLKKVMIGLMPYLDDIMIVDEA
jgi:hypothetical protein